MKINNKILATSVLPLAALGFIAVADNEPAVAASTEVANACPIDVSEIGMSQEDEEVFFVSCGGFF